MQTNKTARRTWRRPGRDHLGTAGLLATGVALFISLPAHAVVIIESLDFTAQHQSMWGPSGVSEGFLFADSTGVELPFGLGDFNVGYSVGASTGQVWGNVNGNLSTSYADLLTMPGLTSIGLSYSGDPSGGSLHTTVGAHATLTAGITVGPDFQLNVNRTYTPVLDTQVTASNALDNIVTLPLVNVVAAEAGVGLGVSQTDRFTPTGIGGTLFYSLQGSGIVNTSNFLLGTNAGLSLPVNLDQFGIYDFWFGNSTLENRFNLSMALDLTAYASTAAGCGFLGLESCTWSTTLLSPTIYTNDPFALNFDAVATRSTFQIEVRQVPEPSSLALLGIACLLGAIGRCRRRHALAAT